MLLASMALPMVYTIKKNIKINLEKVKVKLTAARVNNLILNPQNLYWSL